jgi:hypothetical protein
MAATNSNNETVPPPVVDETEKSSPTTSGPDSDEVASSVDDLSHEEQQETQADGHVTDELSTKVSAGANYLGSMFSNAWTKTAKTANDASATSSSFLSTTFSPKVGTPATNSEANSAKTSPKVESNSIVVDSEKATEITAVEVSPKVEVDNTDSNNTMSASASTFFSSAWNKVGGFSRSTTSSSTNAEEVTATTEDKPGNAEILVTEKKTEKGANFFANFSSIMGNATTVIKDKVSTATMIGEFNKEQDDFIKSKAGTDLESGLPPWVGYQEEEAMKAKILSLSKDKRNFVRAPPAGVSFEFDYASVSSVAMALLQDDPQLDKMRYDLVPKQVKEDEFWRNYFYRVNLIKQSFDLKDLESSGSNKKAQAEQRLSSNMNTTTAADEDVNNIPNPDHDDEFVSESYQASSQDIDEANASMKRLGVGGNEEWEAELEGELNEFEIVSSKDDNDSNDPEWENQIQQMLDAEESSDQPH